MRERARRVRKRAGAEHRVVIEHGEVRRRHQRQAAREFCGFGTFAVARRRAGEHCQIWRGVFGGEAMRFGVVIIDQPNEVGVWLIAQVCGEARFQRWISG